MFDKSLRVHDYRTSFDYGRVAIYSATTYLCSINVYKKHWKKFQFISVSLNTMPHFEMKNICVLLTRSLWLLFNIHIIIFEQQSKNLYYCVVHFRNQVKDFKNIFDTFII